VYTFPLGAAGAVSFLDPLEGTEKLCVDKTRKELLVDTTSAAQAVETLVHDYYKLVFHTIYSLTGNWEESQDLTQDTFQQALKGIDAARSASGTQFRPKAWLLRIALNNVRMQRRRRNLFRFIPFSHMQKGEQQSAFPTMNRGTTTDAVDNSAAPVQPAGYGVTNNEDPALLIAERDAIQRTMAHLPESLRTCLILSVVASFSTAEIAALLDIQEAAVRQRLARARKQFQQFYALESGETITDTTNLAEATHQSSSGGKDKHVTFLHSHASPLL
jgi:RNA polymerase sigma factor (sigma-70 family)